MEIQTPATAGKALKGLLIAALIAVAALFLVVLPAERNYDPTGIGHKLGLTRKAPEKQTWDEVIEDVIGANDNLTAAKDADPDTPMKLPNPAVSQIEPGAPHTETITVKLGWDEKTEIKAVMAKAKVITYSWSVEGGKVYVDFHGHDPSKGEKYWVRYEEADGITGRSGSLVAPFAGEHGWFWLNVSETPITIKLTVTGYFDKLKNYGLLQ